MATTYKILGQARPAVTTVADLYTVPSATQAVVSTITATNVDGTASDISIYVVAAAGSASEANALVFEAELGANTIQAFTLGLTLGAGDKLAVQSATASAATYQAFGSELS
jgi:hypothetical protein